MSTDLLYAVDLKSLGKELMFHLRKPMIQLPLAAMAWMQLNAQPRSLLMATPKYL
jgi:hypothetical protein